MERTCGYPALVRAPPLTVLGDEAGCCTVHVAVRMRCLPTARAPAPEPTVKAGLVIR
jgi:hypothetical protein